MKTKQLLSKSPADTEQLAASIGAHLRGSEVIELISDLGGGKTTFVRGLARGLGSPDKVASPTFTLSREYKAGQCTLFHFDFYRLSEAGIMTEELAELIGQPQTIVVVEWGEIIQDVLPANKITISLSVKDENTRQIIVKYPEELSYLFSSH